WRERVQDVGVADCREPPGASSTRAAESDHVRDVGPTAEVLEIDPAAYRKRLWVRLHDFLRGWCGVFDEANPCLCAGQVESAVERGLLAPDDLNLSFDVERRNGRSHAPSRSQE